MENCFKGREPDLPARSRADPPLLKGNCFLNLDPINQGLMGNSPSLSKKQTFAFFPFLLPIAASAPNRNHSPFFSPKKQSTRKKPRRDGLFEENRHFYAKDIIIIQRPNNVRGWCVRKLLGKSEKYNNLLVHNCYIIPSLFFLIFCNFLISVY